MLLDFWGILKNNFKMKFLVKLRKKIAKATFKKNSQFILTIRIMKKLKTAKVVNFLFATLIDILFKDYIINAKNVM